MMKVQVSTPTEVALKIGNLVPDGVQEAGIIPVASIHDFVELRQTLTPISYQLPTLALRARRHQSLSTGRIP
jgi:hypothetical protein